MEILSLKNLNTNSFTLETLHNDISQEKNGLFLIYFFILIECTYTRSTNQKLISFRV